MHINVSLWDGRVYCNEWPRDLKTETIKVAGLKLERRGLKFGVHLADPPRRICFSGPFRRPTPTARWPLTRTPGDFADVNTLLQHD